MRIATYRHIDGAWDVPFEAGMDGPATLVLAFGGRAPELPLAELVAAHPRAVVLGCSTAGQIRDAGIDDGGVSAAVIRFEHTGLRRAAAAMPDQAASYDAGRAIAAELIADGDLRGVFVLAAGSSVAADPQAAADQRATADPRAAAEPRAATDPRPERLPHSLSLLGGAPNERSEESRGALLVDGSQLARGLNDALPPGVVVTGGLAAAGPDRGIPTPGDRGRTWVLQDGRPHDGWVTAVGLYGDRVRIGHGSRGGWDIFGPQRLVTRSEGNVLYELDGRPALDLYRQYLGDLADDLPAAGARFPLALREHRDAEKQLVRTILSVDEDSRSMTFAGDIPQGTLAQLMRANFDRLVAGAESAAQLTRAAEVAGPCLAIAISCAGRRMVLGEGSEEEVEATLDFLPPGTRQIGFYGYGELAPYSAGPCDLHNQTMTVTTVQEVARP